MRGERAGSGRGEGAGADPSSPGAQPGRLSRGQLVSGDSLTWRLSSLHLLSAQP